MKFKFPYKNYEALEIPDAFAVKSFDLTELKAGKAANEIVSGALESPIGSKKLSELAKDKEKILIVSDDFHRPTPVYEFVKVILNELYNAGATNKNIEFMMALGSHRPMTRQEMSNKLGSEIVENFKVHNSGWDKQDDLEFMGDTDQGVPVWINKKVKR